MSFYSETDPTIGIPRKTGSLITKALPKDGNRIYSVETPAVIDPITVDELKAFSRIDYSDEDPLLFSFIKTVTSASEKYTGRAFIKRTTVMKMDYWPGTIIELPYPPLISVTKVATLDEDDTETEYSSDNYYILTNGTPGKLVLKQGVSEPINTDRDYGGFLVRYKNGYGDTPDDIPEDLKLGLMMWAAKFQATRIIDPKNPPPEVASCLDQFRIVDVMIR